MRIRFLFFVVLATLPCLAAAASNKPEYLSLEQLLDSVAGAPQAADLTAGKALGDRGTYKYVIVRRDRSGEVEVHDNFDDVIVVEEGSGMVVSGGEVQGGREPAPSERGAGPGEWRGGEIDGGTTQRVAAGDVMVIPAGVPHRVEVDKGGSITYLIVKIKPAG